MSCKYRAFNTSQRRTAKHFAKHRWSLIIFRKAISAIHRGKSCWEMMFLDSGHPLPSVSSSLLYHDWFPEPSESRNCVQIHALTLPCCPSYEAFPQKLCLWGIHGRLVHSLHTHHKPKPTFADQWGVPKISRRGHATFTAQLLPEENANLTEAI